MVWNASDTSTMVKTLAFVSRGSFSSMVGIVYLGLLIVLFIVWLGSIQMRSLPFGFFLTIVLDSQSVGWVTGLIIPFSQSLFSSSFIWSKFATGTRGFVACTGVTEGSNSICIGVPRCFPRSDLNTLAYCCKCPPPSAFRVGEVFAEFAESCPQLRLFRLHKSSNTP